ncbi:MAG: hypothetical protein LUG62_00845 [Clostridiales bacterium]|nr:hypothetical protein [Clostridiales bacterium]
MKYTVEVTRDLTAEDRALYDRMNQGMTPTGELLKETFPDGSSQTLVVFRAKFTPYGYCRDCGDHYIIARHSRYDRIDKKTLEITSDVDDE